MTVFLTHARELKKMHITQELYIIVIRYVKFDTKDDSIIHISSQDQLMPSKYDWVLDTHIFMLGS